MNIPIGFLLLSSVLGAAVVPPGPPDGAAMEPNTRLAMPLGHWPDKRDLARLQSVEGRPAWQVLLILGHPRQVFHFTDGQEAWHYPWQAACAVSFKNGVCVGTFYTAGL